MDDQESKSSSVFSLRQPAEKASSNSSNNILLEPVYPESYELSYTCLLIPRKPSHHLETDLAENLSRWLKEICVLHKWHIEFISIQPEYFQWGLRVVSSTPAGQFMQEIRQSTSQLILATYGQLRREISTNDFWATGYLVVLGTRPHPKEMVEQFIRLSRRQQGLTSS